MTLDPDAIILTHGCMEALQLALRAVTQPGNTVGLETPTYFSLLPLLTSLGLQVIEIPTDPNLGLSVDAVEALLAAGALHAIVAMPTVQNPLGSTMPLAAKQRLAALVNRYQVPLIEDALYAELQFNSPLSPTVKSMDENGWVIICSSYTKTLAPDYRIGWVEGGRFGDEIKRLKFSSSISESLLLSEAVAMLLESGGYDHHLRTLRQRYATQVARSCCGWSYRRLSIVWPCFIAASLKKSALFPVCSIPPAADIAMRCVCPAVIRWMRNTWLPWHGSVSWHACWPPSPVVPLGKLLSSAHETILVACVF